MSDLLLSVCATPDGKLEIKLGACYEDPRVWGIVLADVARMVASVYSQEKGQLKFKLIRDVVHIMDLELNSPTGDIQATPVQEN